MHQKDQPQNRPRSPKHAPDPATTYERAKPEKTPHPGAPDDPEMETDPADMNVGQNNAQPTDRQINAQDEPPEAGAPAQPLNQIDLGKSRPTQR